MDAEPLNRMVAQLRAHSYGEIFAAGQPRLLLLRVQDHRHPVLHIADRVVGGAGQDGAGQDIAPPSQKFRVPTAELMAAKNKKP
jgi:hypothetical protein